MAIRKPSAGFTMFPNEVLDNLDKYTHTEYKVLSLIIRKNIGFNSPNKKFSCRYVAGKTGMNKDTAAKVLESLVEREDVICYESPGEATLYDINWVEPSYGGVPIQGTVVSQSRGQVKETRVKENNHAYKEIVSLYFGLFRDAYGMDPVFTSKDGTMIKHLLKSLSPEDSFRALKAYFADSDKYLVSNRHPLGLFVNKINKYRTAPKPGWKPMKGA